MPSLDVATAVLGVLALYVFYRVVETEWPQSYHSVQDLNRYATTVTPLRYLLFRLAPPALACFLVAAVSFRDGRNGWQSGVLVIVVHVAITVGKAIVEGRLWREMKKPYFWSHVIVAVVLVAVGLAACAIASIPSTWSVVPRFEDASTELWTALIAGLIGAFFVKTTSRRDVVIDEVIAKAKERLGTALVTHAHDIANQYETDPLFVEAVMIVESLQRPKWFRVLEHRFGPMVGAKSYGVMQVPNSQPMSDEESVIQAVRGYFIGFQVTKGEQGIPDTDEVREAAFGYNPSSEYADLVAQVYFSLWLPTSSF